MPNKIVKHLQSSHAQLIFKVIACFGGLFLMFVILSPIASLQIRSGSELASPRTTVHGKVVFEDTGKPVRQTVVTLLNLSGQGNRENSVLTDYDGSFVMENMMPGKYFPMIISPGILTPFSYVVIDENINRINEEEISSTIEKNVQPVKVGTEKDLDVTIVAHRGGSISGQVLYGDGTPAYGVAIEALRKIDDKYAPVFDFQNIERMGNPVIITDEKGNYRASALPPGEYIIRTMEAVNHGSKPEIMPMMGPFVGYFSSLFSTFYPSTMTPGDAQKIEVKANRETPAANIKIVQRSSHTIHGRLIDRTTKEPLANTTVYLRKVGNPASFLDFAYIRDSRGRVEARTDGKGIWQMDNIPNGDYKISTQLSSRNFSTNYLSAYQNVYGSPVTERNTYAANMAANTANVAANAANMANKAATNVTVTTTSVIVNKSSSRRSNSNINMIYDSSPYRAPKQYVDTEKDIKVTDASQPETVLEVSAASAITGKIEKDNKTKLSNAVTIIARDEQQQTESSAYVSSGYGQPPRNSLDFSLNGIGTSNVWLDFSTFGNAETSYYLKSIKYQGKEFLAKPLAILPESTLENIEVIVGTDTGMLSGKALSASSKTTLPSTALLFIPADENLWNLASWRRRVWTDSAGEFSVSLIPAKYFVFAFSNEDARITIYADWIRKNQNQAQQIVIAPNQKLKMDISF